MLTTGYWPAYPQVLTTGYWPAYPPAPLKIPRELLEHLEAFEKFYLSKHQGRRLTWQARAHTRTHAHSHLTHTQPLVSLLGGCLC